MGGRQCFGVTVLSVRQNYEISPIPENPAQAENLPRSG
jgi:hypothetical protein